MNASESFLIATGITLVVTLLIVTTLWKPFLGILIDLCGTESRALFWRSFSSIILILIPLATLFLGRASDQPQVSTPGIFLVTDQLRWALLGLIAALVIIGGCLNVSINARASNLNASNARGGDLDQLVEKKEVLRMK